VAFPPVPSGVGMIGLLQLPVMRSLAIAAQAIFVDRGNPESRRSCKEAIQERTLETWHGPPLMIFPQGVITNGTALTQFNVGAFSPGKAVTPVCLRYPWRHYNPSGCGQNHMLGLALLRTLLQFKNECEIEILDTYVPSAAEVADDRLFANNLRRVMAANLCVPCTEQSYEDAFLAYGSRAHIGSDFEVGRLRRMYGCSVEDLKAVLRSFEDHNLSGSGALSYAEFCGAMRGLADDDRLGQEALFAYFDQDRSGAIEYRDFIQVAALLSGRGSESSRRQLAFLISDVDQNDRAKRHFLQQLADVGPGDQDLPFEAFCDLCSQCPALVESAMQLLRRHLKIPLFGESSSGDKKKV